MNGHLTHSSLGCTYWRRHEHVVDTYLSAVDYKDDLPGSVFFRIDLGTEIHCAQLIITKKPHHAAVFVCVICSPCRHCMNRRDVSFHHPTLFKDCPKDLLAWNVVCRQLWLEHRVCRNRFSRGPLAKRNAIQQRSYLRKEIRLNKASC